MCMNSIQNWSAVKAAVPSTVQQQLHFEEMFVLIFLYVKNHPVQHIDVYYGQKLLEHSHQNALRAL